MFARSFLFKQFSSAAKKEVNHAPPKKVIGLSGRYAGALYSAASKGNALDAVETELLAVSQTLKKNAGFAAFLYNPTVPRAEKVSKVNDLVDSKFSNYTRNLMSVLAANGRIRDINKVIGAYSDLMEARRGTVKATIVSAEALKKESTEQIQKAVMTLLGKDKTVDLSYKVDPSIIGGLQILVGDTIMDLSIASRVTDLSIALETKDA